MSFHSVVYLHHQGLMSLMTWWPVVIFVLLAEMFLLIQSKVLTRGRSVEAALSTALPFLLVFWGIALLPEPYRNGVTSIPLILAMALALLMAGIRSLASVFIFEVPYVWAILSSLPLPLFVYFTAWVTIK